MERKKEFKCNQCNHEWDGKFRGKVPVACPKCKSYDWNKKDRVKERQRKIQD